MPTTSQALHLEHSGNQIHETTAPLKLTLGPHSEKVVRKDSFLEKVTFQMKSKVTGISNKTITVYREDIVSKRTAASPKAWVRHTWVTEREQVGWELKRAKTLQDAYLKGLMGPYISCHYNHPFQWSQSVPFDGQEVWSRRQLELSWNQDMVDPSSLIPEPMFLSTTHIRTQKILIVHINVFSLCWIETSSTKIFYFPSGL